MRYLEGSRASLERHNPPYLAAHLDVDLVLSPLPADGIVPTESHKAKLQFKKTTTAIIIITIIILIVALLHLYTGSTC